MQQPCIQHQQFAERDEQEFQALRPHRVQQKNAEVDFEQGTRLIALILHERTIIGLIRMNRTYKDKATGPNLQTRAPPHSCRTSEIAVLIDINPMDPVNPDQDIAPTFKHVISKAHGNHTMPPAGKHLANVYAPSGKLCGTITFERL